MKKRKKSKLITEKGLEKEKTNKMGMRIKRV